jgi:hypothetical protein
MPLPADFRGGAELFGLIGVALAVFGLIQCCWGYRIWGLMLFLWGLTDGLIGGAVIVQVSQPREPGVAIGIMAVCALVAGALYAGIRPLGTFLVGATLGAAVIQAVGDAGGFPSGTQQEAAVAMMAVAALLSGVIFAVAGRAGVIILSSFLGATTVVSGVYVLINVSRGMAGAEIQTDGMVLGIIAAVAIVSMLIQFGTTSQPSKEAADAREPAPIQSETASTSAGQSAARPTAGAPVGAGDESIEARLQKLRSLRSAGTIGEDEYERHKKRILSDL